MPESHRRKFVAGSIVMTELADGILAASTAGRAKMADGFITAAKLSATMKKGFANLDFTTAKIIAANAIGNLTEGMLPDGNSAPSLARVNGATDKALRLIWAGGSQVEVQFAPWAKPADLDDAAVLTVNLLMGKGSNTDTAAVVAIDVFDGIGDTNAGGNTAALAVSTPTLYTVTLAASDLAAAPGVLNISLTPGTHATDAIHLYAAWIEYSRT